MTHLPADKQFEERLGGTSLTIRRAQRLLDSWLVPGLPDSATKGCLGPRPGHHRSPSPGSTSRGDRAGATGAASSCTGLCGLTFIFATRHLSAGQGQRFWGCSLCTT